MGSLRLHLGHMMAWQCTCFQVAMQPCSCCRLKAFLDGVTPEEWFLSQAAAREAKRAAMRAEWQAACDTLAAHKAEAAAAKQRAEHDMQWARTQQQWERAQRAARDAAAALRDALAQQVGGQAGGRGLQLLQRLASSHSSHPCLSTSPHF